MPALVNSLLNFVHVELLAPHWLQDSCSPWISQFSQSNDECFYIGAPIVTGIKLSQILE